MPVGMLYQFLTKDLPEKNIREQNAIDQQKAIDLNEILAQDPTYQVGPRDFQRVENYNAALPGMESTKVKAFTQQAQPDLERFKIIAQDPRMQTVAAQNFLAQRGVPAGEDYVPGSTSQDIAEKYGRQTEASDFSQNPVFVQGVNDQTDAARNYATLMQAQEGDPAARARLALNKELSQPFHQTAQGLKENIGAEKERGAIDEGKQLDKFKLGLGEIDKGTYGQPGVVGTFMPALTKTVRDFQTQFPASDSIGKAADDYLKAQAERQRHIPFETRTRTITQGNATTKQQYDVNAMGEPVDSSKVSVTNHPPQQKDPNAKEPKIRYVQSIGDITHFDGSRGPGLMTFDLSIPEQSKLFSSVLTSGQGYEVSPESNTVKDFQNGASVKTKVSPMAKTAGANKGNGDSPPEKGTSRSGKPMIKIDGNWVYE